MGWGFLGRPGAERVGRPWRVGSLGVLRLRAARSAQDDGRWRQTGRGGAVAGVGGWAAEWGGYGGEAGGPGDAGAGLGCGAGAGGRCEGVLRHEDAGGVAGGEDVADD